jgi:hypothetical protein
MQMKPKRWLLRRMDMLKSDSESPAVVSGTTVKWPVGADSIRRKLSKDLKLILNKSSGCWNYIEDGLSVPEWYLDELHTDIRAIAKKYADLI